MLEHLAELAGEYNIYTPFFKKREELKWEIEDAIKLF